MSRVDLTKSRLLQAAGEEFAEKGFEDAGVRAICKRARVKNQAAVNYHFGDKEQLYIAAVMEAHRCSVEDEMTHTLIPEGSPSDRLREFIRRFVRSVMERRQKNGWHHALMFREMLHPTSAIETLVRESIRPTFDLLMGILREVCPEADSRRLHALAFSVIGQCLHYKFAEPVSSRLVGSDAFEALDADFVADHIATFSLAALGLAPPFDGAGHSTPRGEAEAMPVPFRS